MRSETLREKVEQVIADWPWNREEPIQGSDLVEYMQEWVEDAKIILQRHKPVMPRVLLGMQGGISCGHRSNVPVSLQIVDHDILQDTDPDPKELEEYRELCEEMDILPFSNE